MSGFSWWLAERLSLLLDPAERDAVRGDLAESGEGGIAALGGMAGLVARRTWWPVCALLLATAMGWRLVRELDWLIRLSATYLWMYLANWRAADIGNLGFWREMAMESLRLMLPCLLLMAGSLVAGMVVSRARRGATAVFWIALALANLANVPREPFLAPIALYAYAFSVWTGVVILPAILGLRLMRHRLP